MNLEKCLWDDLMITSVCFLLTVMHIWKSGPGFTEINETEKVHLCARFFK